MQEYKKTTVKRSIQKFRDYANDFIKSDMNTFDDRLNVFVHFCVTDEVFSKIDLQLSSNQNVDVLVWYKESVSKMGSMGTAKLSFPVNEIDRLSFLYLIVKALSEKKIRKNDFLIRFFATGSSKMDSYIITFINAIVIPLVRELDYKLEEIESSFSASANENVPASILQIINAGDNFIQQISQGNENTQKASIKIKNVELEKLIAELKNAIMSDITDKNEKLRAIDLANGVEKELSLEEPNKTVISTLLKAIPVIGSIGSI
ncbi:MAG: hypothetical protein ACYC5R_04390, partial [Melioribacteraceae bacterium]